MAQLAARLEGVEELNKKLKNMETALNKGVGKTALAQAEKLRDRIRQKAPQGPTGNLKRSAVAKLLPAKPNYPIIAIAGIDIKIAKHAWLVEFGGKNVRVPRKSTLLVSKHTGEVFGTQVAPMPAHPFFRPAIDEIMPKMKDSMKQDLKKDVESVV